MTKFIRAALPLLALLVVTACESDAAKLERLKTAELVSSLDVRYWKDSAAKLEERKIAGLSDLDSVAFLKVMRERDKRDSAQERPVYDHLRSAETAHDLAVRDLNRFMGPR